MLRNLKALYKYTDRELRTLLLKDWDFTKAVACSYNLSLERERESCLLYTSDAADER